MVFFTCNVCGASLKKNQVEKHYQNECPNCEVLSCMDCGRDFYGDAYADHVKCISEAEKYQGSLYKESGKGGPGKGERKQKEWLERVKQTVSGAKVNPRVAGLLEKIADYSNIPRKRAKFENFVRNSFNVRDQKTLGQLWDAFSGTTEQAKSQGVEKTTQKVETERMCLDNQETEDSVKVSREDLESSSKKKKKKAKEQKESSGTLETQDLTESVADVNGYEAAKPEAKKKKMKKKKKFEEQSEVTVSNGVEDFHQNGGDLTEQGDIDRAPEQRDVETMDLAGDDGDKATARGVEGERLPQSKKSKKKRLRERESCKEDESDSRKKQKCDAVRPQKRVKGDKSKENADCEMSDSHSPPVVKKHKKKHKHSKARLLTSEA